MMASFYYALGIFFFRLLFPHENSKTIGTNYVTKENRQSILVEVVKQRHHADVLLSGIYDMSLWLGGRGNHFLRFRHEINK
jgi:hypothetical protein